MTKQEMIVRVGECLKLQDAMNSIVNPKWKTAGYRFERAAWLEMAEAMGPTDWKWWKKQSDDRFQTMLEMVDIFHFMLSDAIINDKDGLSAWVIASAWETTKTTFRARPNDIQYAFQHAEKFIVDAIDGKLIWKNFFSTMLALDISFETVLKYYVSKNTLNIFRQKNGYKEGTYIKDWLGEEDNKFLESQVSGAESVTYDDLYAALTKRYSEVVSASKTN